MLLYQRLLHIPKHRSDAVSIVFQLRRAELELESLDLFEQSVHSSCYDQFCHFAINL